MIYADYAATAPMREGAIAAVTDAMRHVWGNPSSVHEEGGRAKALLEDCRERCAALLGCLPREIVFTSGGTESDNLAVFAASERGRETGRLHIVSTAIEHHAVLRPLERLRREGFDVTLLSPDGDGWIDPEAVRSAMREDTCFVSVMTANNEVGTVEPVKEIAALCRERGVPFHTDAVQAAGHLPLDFTDSGYGMLSLSAHKFGGPRGAGILCVQKNIPVPPLLAGGGQERGRRSGTENVAAVAGMTAALEEAVRERDGAAADLIPLRDRLIRGLLGIPGSALNGPGPDSAVPRLPNNVNVSFEGTQGEPLLLLLDARGIRASSGAACSAGALEPSHVLLAMGKSPDLARGSLRLTVGGNFTEADADEVIAAVGEAVERLRSFR